MEERPTSSEFEIDAFRQSLETVRQASANVTQLSGVLVLATITVVGFAIANESWGMVVAASLGIVGIWFSWKMADRIVKPILDFAEEIEARNGGSGFAADLAHSLEDWVPRILWFSASLAALFWVFAPFAAVALDWTFAGG